MPFFSEQIVEEIRARTDIVDLVSQRVSLRRAGSDFKACCPFHHEKTPSFIVSPSRRSFHCFGCGVQGDVFKFLMLSEGLTFPEAVKTLAERCGVALEVVDDPGARRRKLLVKLHNDLAGFYRRCLLQLKEAETARAYVARRKIDDQTAEQFRLGYAPLRRGVLLEWAKKYDYRPEDLVEAGLLRPPRSPGDDYYDGFRGRLMFPICDQGGQVVGFSGRILVDDKHAAKYYNSPETPIFKKSRVLYGLCFAKRAITRLPRREVLVCEGQIDVIRCHACGFANAVASQGTAFTEEHVALLKPYADAALLVFDGDAAGLKAATRTGRLFLAAGMPVQVATLPPGEDPDSILRDKGNEAFQRILDAPVSLAAFQIRALRAAEAAPDSIDAVAHITDELFETFASCSKEVLRSYLIQEAAELMHLPLSALESDFAAYQANLARRRAAHAQTSAPPAAPASAASAAQTSPAPAGPTSPAPAAQTSPALAGPTSAPPGAPPRRRRFPETPALSLADFLLKTSTSPSEENAALADFIAQWYPPSVRGDGPVRDVIDAALADRADGGGRLAALLSEGDEGQRALVAYLSRRASPLFASNLPLEDAVHDLVGRAWIDFLRQAREQIDPNDEDGQLRRLRLSSAIRRLESDPSWSARSALIEPLLGE